jgi:glycine/D-amino acid oxidase-like deaminating enzyme
VPVLERVDSVLDRTLARVVLAVSQEHATRLRADVDAVDRRAGAQEQAALEWLEPADVKKMEPGLAPTWGAAFAVHDGAVDNILMLTALERLVANHERIATVDALVVAVNAEAQPAIVRTSRSSIQGNDVVLCAGAWTRMIDGPRFARAVEPVRGQLLSFDHTALGHAVYAPAVYLVPRASGCTLAGSTMEWVGFDPRTTETVVSDLAMKAAALYPQLGSRPTTAWAGLRPVTPDLLPLLGRSPIEPALIYACGHSRNGVLLAPMTAELLARIIFEESLNYDLRQFDPARFEGTFTKS